MATKKQGTKRTIKVIGRKSAIGKALLPTFQEQREAKARESATGRTPTPEELGAGTKLEWPRKGQVHRAQIVKLGDGAFVMRVGKQVFKSLSSAAQAISGHAERGGTTWRREGQDQPLLGRPDYRAAGATPAPRTKKAAAPKAAPKAKRAPRARKGNGTGGTVKITKGVKCQQKGCGQMIAATDLAAHMATHAPE